MTCNWGCTCCAFVDMKCISFAYHWNPLNGSTNSNWNANQINEYSRKVFYSFGSFIGNTHKNPIHSQLVAFWIIVIMCNILFCKIKES